MKNVLFRAVFPAIGVLIWAAQPAAASFHVMQIEQVIGGVNGDTTAQAIQLRQRAAGQNLVNQARIRAWDAAGANPIVIHDFSTNVACAALGSRILIASDNFLTSTTPSATRDFAMTNMIPASYLAAGSLTFEDNTGATVYWRLSWGGASYTGSNLGSITNDANGNFGPAWPGALPSTCARALQFTGVASAMSVTNAGDYALTASAAVFSKDAGSGACPAAPTYTVNTVAGACCGDSDCVAGICNVGACIVDMPFNFRITEISPNTDQAEVTNTGGAQVTSQVHPFCHQFDYASVVSTLVSFAAGEAKVFTVGGLDNADSDIWLYVDTDFGNAASIIHGAKYGPASGVGRTALAATVSLWPSDTVYAPAPPVGMTLAYDGFGNDPKDWYIDETPTLGSADSTPSNTVPNGLAWPSGMQDFEGMSLGDQVNAITSWVIVNGSTTPGIYTIRAVNDVMGDIIPHGPSTQWLRVRDQEGGAGVQNRFYSNEITAPANDLNYTWTYYINLEETPPSGAGIKPRVVMQHRDNSNAFGNAWGVEFTDTGANLVVTGIGGTAMSTPLYSLSSPTGVGDWVKIDLTVDFGTDMVSASGNDGTPVSLPINLNGDTKRYRFCYRGEDTNNRNTMLIDDVSFVSDEPPPIPTVTQWGIITMATLMLTAGTVLFGSRKTATA